MAESSGIRPNQGDVTSSAACGRNGIGRRCWEQGVRDEGDLKRCVDDIHGNPRKHELVPREGLGMVVIPSVRRVGRRRSQRGRNRPDARLERAGMGRMTDGNASSPTSGGPRRFGADPSSMSELMRRVMAAAECWASAETARLTLRDFPAADKTPRQSGESAVPS